MQHLTQTLVSANAALQSSLCSLLHNFHVSILMFKVRLLSFFTVMYLIFCILDILLLQVLSKYDFLENSHLLHITCLTYHNFFVFVLRSVDAKKTVKILILIGFEDKQPLGKHNSFNQQANTMLTERYVHRNIQVTIVRRP